MRKGFTLIELLVVISIIGLLASVVLSSLNSARVNARDAQRLATMDSMKKAMELYYHNNGSLPAAGYGNGGSDLVVNFNNLAQTLVAAGLLGSVPASPTSGEYYDYQYYRRVLGGRNVAMISVRMEDMQIDSSNNYANSCRPNSGNYYCGNVSSEGNRYCKCVYE